jgi:serine/threonine protein phosphatase 1
MLKLPSRLWQKKSEPQQRRARITIPPERVSDIFAIGDVHGRLDLLLEAERKILERVLPIGRPALVVCVGDFVDRGPDSRGVIEHLTRKMTPPLYRIPICGNHDDLFLNFLVEEHFDPVWIELGGDKTLMSYGIDAAQLLRNDPGGRQLKMAARDAVPISHIKFLEALPVALSFVHYLFVHAGIVPGRPLVEQSDFDLMWIREPFMSTGPGLDMTVVHGHTPVSQIQFGPHRIGIDTGAFATGKLSVLHIGPHGAAAL